MPKLVFSAIASLDGYIEDEAGKFDWARPDEEVHAFINDLKRPIVTHLYGRRMYETLAAWETLGTGDEEPQVIRDFGETWRAAEKIVYSRTLETVSTARTRIERAFTPEQIRELKQASQTDLHIGGPELAAQAMRAGLLDELHLFVNPVLVGGGKSALPREFRAQLELISERCFGSGVVHLHYRLSD